MVLSYGCCRVALFVTALAKRGSYPLLLCAADDPDRMEGASVPRVERASVAAALAAAPRRR